MHATTDLCDELGEAARVCEPLFADFGGVDAFEGPIVTLETYEDNTKVRATLEGAGEGRVLVVDGGGSTACALLGGKLAELAETNGWAGVVIHGCVRDTAEIEAFAVGVKALAAVPRKSRKDDAGEIGVPLNFAGVTFESGHYLVADRDGIIVLDAKPE